MTATLRPVHDADGLAALRDATAGRYLVERELGRGGMGIVLLARDLRLERHVALKLLPPGLAAQPELRERFLREARAAASLSHPNIVPVHAVEEGDATFFVMGFVDGETLAERVRRGGSLPAGEAVRVLRDVGWALSYAHARGLVHRDIKPDNILVERATGRALVTDFGIARVADSTMTMAGTALGTPQFMSPEQATGEPLDGRSDLYSLGIVGWFALTGTLPFTAPTMQAILAMQVTTPAEPVSARRAGLPPALASAIDRCLQKDPGARFADADAFVAALEAVEGAAVTAVAPQLRNYLRLAEVAFTQAVTMMLFFPSIAVLRPQATDVLVMFVFVVPLITVWQLSSRVGDLVRDGFTLADLELAHEAEVRLREEELAIIVAARERDGSIARGKRRATVMLAVGVVCFAAAILLKKLAPEIPRTARQLLGGMAGGMIGFSFALRALADPRIERRLSRRAGPWMTMRVSRWLFRRQVRQGAAAGTARAAAAGPGTEAGRLFSELSRAARRALGDLPALVGRLERATEQLGERVIQLEHAALEAERMMTTTPGVTASAIAQLDGRRTALAAELRAASTAASARRGDLQAAIEGIRMGLLRLRSGLGSPADLQPEVVSARALLEEVEKRS